MKKLLLIGCLIDGSGLFAQLGLSPYVINSAAGQGTSGNYSFSFSIGEPVVVTGNNGNNNYYTQGFLQPEYNGTSGALNVQGHSTNITCPGKADGSIVLNISGGHGNLGFEWQHTNADTSIMTNLPAGNYSVKIYDTLPNGNVIPYNNGLALDFIINDATEPCPVTIYHAFSPNNDGKNEIFYIGDIDKYPDNSVYIFNRWGVLLWSGKKYDNITVFWDGRDSKSSLVPEGTYFYIINLKENKVEKGWIQVTK